MFLSGCGVYSFSGSGVAGYHSIAIPLFDNQTAEFGIRENLTEGITLGFVQDNNLKITSETKADLLLSGVVTKYERVPYSFDRQEQVKEYIVRIWVTVNCRATKDDKTVWEEKNLLGFGIYDPSRTDPETNQEEDEQTGRKRAIRKLTQDIVNRTVRTW